MRLLKPDPKAFHDACARIGTPPADCLLIDDLPANVEGAQAAGLQAVLHEGNARTMAYIERFLQ
ncbi:HAD-IA family hydrolase [Actinoplanes sp. TFC3]|uniref:HAD-IA family hydrolase n=1 Tax=Actinoplanes sp. TFC3 TaxID=1710355 RepID=UPI00137B9191|nr:HAD-IA family hydrolase [Actinoplanes sp. TFC3]